MDDLTWQMEEQVVAELSHWDVGYLSRQQVGSVAALRAPEDLLAAIVGQPSSRVRAALIALLLAHPEFAEAALTAARQLPPAPALRLKFLYTAAVVLQQRYAAELRKRLGARWRLLPDWFAAELGLTDETGLARLHALAECHAHTTGERLNWAGTYENAARQLLRRWELEHTWTR